MAGLVYSFLEGIQFPRQRRFAVACAAILHASGQPKQPYPVCR
ncbi:hypothetical protein O5478_17505 [Escherichia coli]|nr:hypothetical protein [Escherichia coli]